MSKRQRQMAEVIRHELAHLFIAEQWHDMALQNLVITISAVDMSPDLKNAKVYFVAQGREMEKPIIVALNKLVPHLKRILAKKLAIRFIPQLRFIPDESFKIAEQIEALLHRQQSSQ